MLTALMICIYLILRSQNGPNAKIFQIQKANQRQELGILKLLWIADFLSLEGAMDKIT